MIKVAVFTSGGDAPGMNAAIRAVTRTAIHQGHAVFGFFEGYKGIINSLSEELSLRSVANIIHRGGTVLKTSRCEEFRTKEGRAKAYQNLIKEDIKCLIGLGGDGTFLGLEIFEKEYPDIQVIGAPCTIDNDYMYSENTIGYATAIETAVEAIDRIRDTASSHQRTFVVEVMGRKSANLAYEVAISAGAECVVDLSEKGSLEKSIEKVKRSIKKGKLSSLIIALEKEGEESSAAATIKRTIIKELEIDCKSVVLGHIQRGGSPLAQDRSLASKMGYSAASQIGKSSGIVVQANGVVNFKKFSELESVMLRSEDSVLILETLAN
ncbi:MAG: 6-phosphofructokinase [Bdellovibrionales bacterium]